jgi:hypothetical protein
MSVCAERLPALIGRSDDGRVACWLHAGGEATVRPGAATGGGA